MYQTENVGELVWQRLLMVKRETIRDEASIELLPLKVLSGATNVLVDFEVCGVFLRLPRCVCSDPGRWNEERRSMETALDRLKRLVYGASTTSKATTASLKGKTRTIPAASVKNASSAISEGRWTRVHGSSRSACSSSRIGLQVTRASK